MHAKWMSHTLTQGLQQLNILPSTKSATADNVSQKSARSSAE